jgi:peptide-methionine (S)-S-oxide reductase
MKNAIAAALVSSTILAGAAMTPSPPSRETATFAGGCFWCIEEVFRQQPGVLEAVSGYVGGDLANPTYQQVCSGRTGHAEAVQVLFDPAVVSFEQLLGVFWKAHDPTQLNRQGADVGTQYRSAIFVHSPQQRAAAEASLRAEDASGWHRRPIVTQISPATVFYPAEDYHQDYYVNNRRAPYCQAVIRPKLQKLDLDP